MIKYSALPPLLFAALLLAAFAVQAAPPRGAMMGGAQASGERPRAGRAARDSSAAARKDSLASQANLPEPDSLMQALSGLGGPQSEKIQYSGQEITFLVRRGVMLLHGSAEVAQSGQKVRADSLIAYNRRTGEIFVSGSPSLDDGTESIEGTEMRYNVDRDRGMISAGHTTFGDWILDSRRLSKVGPDSIYGAGNNFTTCDLDSGGVHYHFESPRIKVLRDKRVFAAPVVLRVGRVPVFALPFVFFPITRGNRVSGILQPRIGVNSVMRSAGTGRTIGNLGYFWAPNDCLDLMGALDIRTSSQTTLRGRTRYSKRYEYDGDFDVRRIWDKTNGSTDYSIFGRHNQNLGEKGRLNAEINFTSSRNLLSRTAFDIQDVLRQSLKSRATFAWRPSWGYFSSTLDHQKMLQQGSSTSTLPSLSLSFNKRSLFPEKSRSLPRRAGLLNPGWLYNMTWGASTGYSNTRSQSESSADRDVHRATGSVDLDTPQTLYGWLKLNPRLRYSATTTHDNQAVESGFDTEQSVNLSTSLSTQLYGIFDGPRVGPVFRWRHSVMPRLTYTYQPDLTGDRPTSRVNRMDFTVSNDIDYKYKVAESQDKGQSGQGQGAGSGMGQGGQGGQPGQEPGVKNGKLFSLRNSLGYDFIRAARRDTLGWGDLNTSLTSSPANFLNIQLMMNHQMVQPGLKEHLKPFMNSLSTTLTLRGTYKAEEGGSTAEMEEEAYLDSQRYPDYQGSAFDMTRQQRYENRRDMSYARSMPWSVNLSHTLNRVRGGQSNNQNLRWSLTFNPTRDWHLVYSSSYNFSRSGLQGQTFILSRDLHCWQANLSLITLPGGRFEFTFSTFVKANPAIRMPDVRRASN